MKLKNTSLLMASLLGGFIMFSSNSLYAYQGDAAYLQLYSKNQRSWEKEDRKIDRRLLKLEKRHNKKPNIVFILSDDIGWGELGSYGGGKLRGTPTPNLDVLARDGMRFLQHYSEPSCTVTRAALMTGRLPVRNGVDVVLFPGMKKGLVAEELTIAEVLSSAGYHTAIIWPSKAGQY